MRKTFKFGIDDRVTIVPCQLDGRVKSISISRDGVEYNVKYYSDKEPKHEWFFDDELELTKEESTVGFN